MLKKLARKQCYIHKTSVLCKILHNSLHKTACYVILKKRWIYFLVNKKNEWNRMKNARQTRILNIIAEQDIETQEELASTLRADGYNVTQATVSRDIKELRLIKTLSKNGSYKYTVSEKAEHNLGDRFVRMFVDSVISITYANNIIVIRTLSGSANVAAEAIDSMQWEEILGTMAGDNTILVVVRTNEETPMVVNRFKEIID